MNNVLGEEKGLKRDETRRKKVRHYFPPGLLLTAKSRQQCE